MNNLTSGLTTGEAALAGGIVGGMFVVSMVFAFVYYILLVIAGWKVFKKAGEKGWKSLIPIYNTYIFYKIVGMKKWFYIMLIAALAVSVITSLMGFDSNNPQVYENLTGTNLIAFLMLMAVTILAIFVSVVYAMRTSKAFGHGVGFAIGLILLQSIFLLILGFGSSKYNKKYVKSLK